MATIDRLTIEIDASSEKAEKKLQSLVNTLNAAKQATSGIRFNHIASSIREIETASSNAESKVSRLLSAIKQLKSEASGIKGFSMKQIFKDSGGGLQGYDAEKLMDMGQYEQLDRRLGILMTKMEEAAQRGNDLGALNFAQQANKIKAQLYALENTTTQTANQFSTLKESIRDASDSALTRGFKSLGSALKRIVLYRGIRAGLNYIAEGFKVGLQNAVAFSRAMGGELAAAMDRLSSAGGVLRNQLGSAFGGLIQAAEPILLRIIALATAAANALAQLFAALGGRMTYKKAVASSTDQANKYSKAAGGAAAAAKEWKNQLLGFDEINRLDSPGDSGGGGGGGGALDDLFGDFEYAEISDFMKRVSDLASSFKISVRDVIFDWKNLNPEQIAEKAVAGLCGLLGGVTGLLIGGVPGAIVGTLTGVGIGLLIDSCIFDHDGVLSRGEVANMLSAALFGLAGGVIGFLAGGGPHGALIGASVGVGVFAALQSVDFLAKGKYSAIISQFATALTALTGALIGFTVGGPAGALLGAAIGIGISAKIESLKFDNSKNESLKGQYKNGLSWFICGVLGLPTDAEWKNYGVKAVNWLGEGFVDLTDELHNIIGGPIEDGVEGIKTFFTQKLPEIKETLSTKWDEIKTDASTKWENIKTDVSMKAESLRSNVATKVESMKTNLSNKWEEIKTGASTAWETFKSEVTTKAEGLRSNVATKSESIKTNLSNKWDEIKRTASSKWEEIKTQVTTKTEGIRSTISTKLESIKMNMQTKWENMKSNTTTKWEEIKTTITMKAEGIRSNISTKFQSMSTTILSKWDDLKQKAQDKWEEIKGKISEKLDAIKDLFHFEWSLPSIKLPHFNVSWIDYGLLSLPSVSVSWYAKGGIFDDPSLIGVGENGKEAVMPLEHNTGWIRDLAGQIADYGGTDSGSTADAVEESGDEIVSAIMSASMQIISAMRETGGGDIDFDRFVRRVTKTQNRQARAAGAA